MSVSDIMTAIGLVLAVAAVLEVSLRRSSEKIAFAHYLNPAIFQHPSLSPKTVPLWKRDREIRIRNVKDLVLQVFVRYYFGSKFLSLRFFLSSVVFTLMSLLLQFAVVAPAHYDEVFTAFLALHSEPLYVQFSIALVFVVSIVSNYFSLGQTFFFLRLLRDNRGVASFIMIAYSDIVLTASIFLFGAALALAAGFYIYGNSFIYSSDIHVVIRQLSSEEKRISSETHAVEFTYYRPLDKQAWLTEFCSIGPTCTLSFHTVHWTSTDMSNIGDYVRDFNARVPFAQLVPVGQEAPIVSPTYTGAPAQPNYRLVVQSALSVTDAIGQMPQFMVELGHFYAVSVGDVFRVYYFVALPNNLLVLLRAQAMEADSDAGYTIVEDVIQNGFDATVRHSVPLSSFAITGFFTSLWIYGAMGIVLLTRVVTDLGRWLLPNVKFFPVRRAPFAWCGLVVSGYVAAIGGLWMLLSG